MSHLKLCTNLVETCTLNLLEAFHKLYLYVAANEVNTQPCNTIELETEFIETVNSIKCLM